mgnify:CR=1 FL=1
MFVWQRQVRMQWWIIVGVLGLMVGSLGVATTWSYIKTSLRGIGRGIRDATPIAFDLERLNGELRDLEPEIRRNQGVVAELEVDVESLDKYLVQTQEEQSRAMAEMRKLRGELAENKSHYQFGGQSYKRSEVEADLAKRLDRYEARDAELEAKRQLLTERRRNLEAAVRKVTEYRRQYDQLQAQAESLAAQLKTLETAQAAGSVSIDQSRLGRARELAKEIERRIQVGQRVLQSQQKVEGSIHLEADTRPVTERFDEKFGGEAKSSAK